MTLKQEGYRHIPFGDKKTPEEMTTFFLHGKTYTGVTEAHQSPEGHMRDEVRQAGTLVDLWEVNPKLQAKPVGELELDRVPGLPSSAVWVGEDPSAMIKRSRYGQKVLNLLTALSGVAAMGAIFL